MTVDLLEAITGDRIWTLDDLEDLPDGRYEIVDGRLSYVMPPKWIHDYVAAQIIVALHAAAPPDAAVLAGGGIGIDFVNLRVADTLVVRRKLVVPGIKFGTGDDIVLAVEVMSATTKLNDRVAKPAQYAESGIPHFWRFEPEDALLVGYAIGPEGRYVESARAIGEEAFTVTEPFPVTLVPTSLLP